MTRFYKKRIKCGRCTDSAPEAQDLFYHLMEVHEIELVLYGHYTDDRCSLCGDTLERSIEKQIRHFDEEHTISLRKTKSNQLEFWF